MRHIKKCLIVGGTHGNEMSGLVALNSKVQKQLTQSYSSLDLAFELGNPKAVELNQRFTEQDLNRQFTLDNLANSSDNVSYEAIRARELNERWGPKHTPTIDLLIDIHNTTSNMGATLIILQVDDFHVALARYVKTHMPDANILVEDEKPVAEHPYLCTLGKIPLMIEVGAQPHGVCRAEISKLTINLIEQVLTFCELYNGNAIDLSDLDKTTAYRLTGTVFYPTEINNELLRQWSIHPHLQDNDFAALKSGEPIFIAVDGKVQTWESETTYPHFINEAAYHQSNIAFATADKIIL